VTGVQTCALPIFTAPLRERRADRTTMLWTIFGIIGLIVVIGWIIGRV
jgi:hypothetical protein